MPGIVRPTCSYRLQKVFRIVVSSPLGRYSTSVGVLYQSRFSRIILQNIFDLINENRLAVGERWIPGPLPPPAPIRDALSARPASPNRMAMSSATTARSGKNG